MYLHITRATHVRQLLDTRKKYPPVFDKLLFHETTRRDNIFRCHLFLLLQFISIKFFIFAWKCLIIFTVEDIFNVVLRNCLHHCFFFHINILNSSLLKNFENKNIWSLLWEKKKFNLLILKGHIKFFLSLENLIIFLGALKEI